MTGGLLIGNKCSGMRRVKRPMSSNYYSGVAPFGYGNPNGWYGMNNPNTGWVWGPAC
jgi:hypothetical protein